MGVGASYGWRTLVFRRLAQNLSLGWVYVPSHSPPRSKLWSCGQPLGLAVGSVRSCGGGGGGGHIEENNPPNVLDA